MLGYVLATLSNSPFSRHGLPSIWMWLSRGKVFFAAVNSGFHNVILKEPKRLFRIYFQRVVMLHCELNYLRVQNQSLPFELGVLSASEFDTRGG